MGKIVQLYSRFHNGEEGYEEWPISPSQAVITDPDTGKTLYETLIEVFQALDDIEGLDVPTLLSDLEDGERVTTLEGYFTNGKAKTAVLADKATADANGNNIASTYITKSVNDLTNYYLKSQTYTKDEVNDLVGAVSQFQYEVATVLPTASAATMFKIYLIPSEEPKEGNIKDEFITIQNGSTYSWEQIGSTAVDLSGYSTTAQMTAAINSALASYATTDAVASAISTALSDYYTKDDVDDALSSYTTTEALTTLLAAKASQSALESAISDLTALINGKQSTSYKNTTLNSRADNDHYPSSRAVVDFVNAETVRAQIAEQALDDAVKELQEIHENSTVEEDLESLTATVNNNYNDLSSRVQNVEDSKIGSVSIQQHEDNELAYDVVVDGNVVGTIQTLEEKSLSDVSYNAETHKLTFTYTGKDSQGNETSYSVSVDVADMVRDYTAGSGIIIENRTIKLKYTVLTEDEYEALINIDDDMFYYTYEDEGGGEGQSAYVQDGVLYISSSIVDGVLYASGRVEEGVFYPSSGGGNNASVQDGIVTSNSRVENGSWYVNGSVTNGVLTI